MLGGRLDELHGEIAFDFLIAGMDYHTIRQKYATSEHLSDISFANILSRLRGRGYKIPFPRRGPKPKAQTTGE